MSNDLSFVEYVKGMERRNFSETVTMEYISVRGNYSSHKPMFDVRSSIEFSLVLLLRKCIKEKLSSDLTKYGPITINIADVIGCAFMCMPDYEWNQHLNDILTSYRDIISYSDWFTAFQKVESVHLDDVVSMPFSYGNNIAAYADEINSNNEYYHQVFVPKYNLMDSYSDIISYYRKLGLEFDEINFPISN